MGPTLGGYIVDHWHWSWIFFINLPVGIVGLLMVTAFVHEDEDIRAANQAAAVEQRKHLDWQGIALLERRASPPSSTSSRRARPTTGSTPGSSPACS